MKYIPLALTLLVTMSAHKCNEKTAAAAGDGDVAMGAEKVTSLLDSKWVVRTIKGNTVTMPDGAEAPWLRLLKDGDKVEGFGGCNSLMGGFQLEGERVQFPNLGSTKKYCEGVQPIENGFMSALRAARKFNVDKSGVLGLMDDAGADLATFTQE
ncbi:MAG: META domain-containing protein [Flavobacteriales bacterium]|nr:META domain-containing protein [Flavobacteriales bacterium]